MLNHYRQKSDYGDCIVSVLATATGVTYERALQSAARDVIPYGMVADEVLYAVFKITGSHWAKRDFMIIQPTIAHYNFPDKPVIVGLRKPEWNNLFHYVAVDGEYFYDPMEDTP